MPNKSDDWTRELCLVKAILDRNQILWFLDMGTLLGAIRDGDFIPWDNDIDIGVVHAEDLHEKLLKACESLEHEGFDVAYCDSSVSIIKKNKVEINLAIYSKDDEFYNYKYLLPGRLASLRHGLKMCLQNKYYIHYKSKRVNEVRMFIAKYRYFAMISLGALNLVFSPLRYVEVKVKMGHLRNLRNLMFRGIELKVPACAEEYLSLRYGADWRVPRQQWIYYQDDKSIAK